MQRNKYTMMADIEFEFKKEDKNPPNVIKITNLYRKRTSASFRILITDKNVKNIIKKRKKNPIIPISARTVSGPNSGLISSSKTFSVDLLSANALSLLAPNPAPNKACCLNLLKAIGIFSYLAALLSLSIFLNSKNFKTKITMKRDAKINNMITIFETSRLKGFRSL